MLGLFIDTSVWLDMAKRRDGQQLIVPLRVLKHQGKLELFVPALVIDEFERNRPRAEAAVSASVQGRFQQLRADIHEFGGEARHDWLEELAHQVPLVSASTLQNFAEIADLLRGGSPVAPTTEDHVRVVQRGLDKRAPLHLQKNSVADTLLIEMYGTLVRSGDESVDQFCFATSNYQDFSQPNGDRRQPHPDLSDLFASENSHYAYEVDGVRGVLADCLGDAFLDEVAEVQLVHTEARTLAEILEAEHEFFDKIWYVRKLILKERIDAGEREPLPTELADGMDAAMRAIEERYGAENVGPWDDWGWGFVHGKLSALRWVLGDEWDFLDT